jgi:hypothetical protein
MGPVIVEAVVVVVRERRVRPRAAPSSLSPLSTWSSKCVDGYANDNVRLVGASARPRDWVVSQEGDKTRRLEGGVKASSLLFFFSSCAINGTQEALRWKEPSFKPRE